KRDLELGPHAVGAAHQDRIDETARHRAEPGEAPDVGDDLGDSRGLRELHDAVDERVAGVDVDARLAIGDRHPDARYSTCARRGEETRASAVTSAPDRPE